MTFTVPLFLIASLAAAIPVVLHMVNRQKATELPFSTLRFLRVSVQKTRRRKRVHDVLLMLLRAAVLLLIAMGLAGPTLTSLSSLWGGSDTAVAIILDNSASMGVIDRGQVRFRTALHAAEQIMAELHEGDQVALFLTGGPALPELGKLDRTHEQVRQILLQWINAPATTAGVTYQRADLAASLQQARSLLGKSEAADKQIYVLSDMQKLSWENAGTNASSAADKATPAEKAEHIPVIPVIPVILVDCSRAPKPNVAVTAVSPTTAVPVAGSPINATVELFNAAPVAQQRRLELYVDGSKLQTSPELSVPPGGRLAHDFTFTPTRSGLHRAEVRLAGDDGSTLDDRRFFAVEVDQGIPVAVVKPQPHEIPYLEDTFYVEQALAPGRSGAWAIRSTSLSAGDLPAEPFAGYKVIFCVNLPALPDESADRLAAYVAGGGSLVWFCGNNVDPQTYNRMDQRTGSQLLPAPLLELRSVELDPDRDSWQIGFFDREHPALRHLAEPAALYESVLVYKHVRMDVRDGSGVWTMARLDDGQPLLLQRSVGRGKVLMLGTSAHVGWSNLPLRPIFLPLLVRLTLDLAGVEQTRHTLLAGSPLVLPLPTATGPVDIEILPPGGEVIRRKAQNQQREPLSTFRYNDTHQIGVYELRLLQSGGAGQIAYAVNVDPDEADPAKVQPDELRRRFGPTPLIFAEDPHDLSDTFIWLREGTSLWQLFLVAVLVALVFETLLSNRLSPKEEDATTTQPPPGMRRLAKSGRGAA